MNIDSAIMNDIDRTTSHGISVVCGGGGFIGGHLVADLLRRGHQVRAVDIKPLRQWHQVWNQAKNLALDLSRRDACFEALEGAGVVYNLAANMGGMGFIEANRALCMLNVLINTHLLEAARDQGVQKFLYASSACVYNLDLQQDSDVTPLKEADAYPAMPEDGYGWEKLFSERMCRHFREDFGLQTYVVRLHNIYGPHGAYDGGREKAPAAICRKVVEAKLSGCHEIEVWGSGEQTRSFTSVEDCLHGIRLLVGSDVVEPLNLGSSETVTINQLVDIVENFAGLRLRRRYDLSAPRGVGGRSSDNTLIQKRLGWQPATPLAEGLEPTYRWIHDRVSEKHGR